MTEQRRLANLRPFPKGRSGNPGGRRKGLSLTAAVRDLMQQTATPALAVKVLGRQRVNAAVEAGLTNTDLMALVVVTLAIQGNLEAIKLAWSYVDGKPRESVDVTGEIEHTVTVESIRRAIGILP